MASGTKPTPNTKNMKEFIKLLDGLLEEKAFANIEGMTANWEESSATNELLVFEVPNAVERIYKLLKDPQHEDVAITILRNLSRVEKCRQPLAHNDKLIREVLATIKAQTVLNSPVKEKCFGFLQNLATDPANQLPFFANESLMDVMAQTIAMEKFGSSKTMALRLLNRIAMNVQCKIALFNNPHIMNAVDKVFNENKRTDSDALKGKEEALNFLWLIAIEKANREPLFKTPFVKYAIFVLSNDPPKCKTKEKSMGFITLLASHVNLRTFAHLKLLKADLDRLVLEEEEGGKTKTMAKSMLQRFPAIPLDDKKNDSSTNLSASDLGKVPSSAAV